MLKFFRNSYFIALFLVLLLQAFIYPALIPVTIVSFVTGFLCRETIDKSFFKDKHPQCEGEGCKLKDALL